MSKNWPIAIGILLIFSCTKIEKNEPTLFQELDPSQSGIDFRNDLSFDENFNIFTYRNYYNGGGVALGDVNKDGLLDIYFTANLSSNKLYLNKGNLQFEDVTEKAGVGGNRAWSTGVVMADINGDGLLDIYVCNSGDISGDNKQNELFINQGDGTFSEEAEKYGLADQGFSTHAVFFDYDKDGDLDVYLLNNSYQAIGGFNKMQNERPNRDPVGGDKLFRNDGERFTDVSEEAGIYGSVIGFGLGITIGDVNQDTWPDIFISNDFFERDYLYINNQDGTFTESLESAMRSISAASMGADIADINGDGLLDIFVTDMLPEPLERLKQVTTFENWDKFQFNKNHGYHYQYSRNMLHINNGDGTFSEMGRLANVEATDWSWGALIFDMDSDGLRDLFVANGIYQDITDLDYLNFIDDEETKVKIITGEGVDYRALIDPIPVNPVSNYAFLNEGDLKFTNKAEEWGLGEPIHSNGAAYGDLNNDGYPDLVVNNVNREAQLFINQTPSLLPENHFIQLNLIGKGKNTEAIGTQILAKSNDQVFYQEQMPNRGFQSSIDPKITLGLGKINHLEELIITWPDNSRTVLQNVPADQLLELRWEDATHFEPIEENPKASIFSKDNSQKLNFTHQENPFVDFDRDRLTYHMFSTEGPAFAKGDVNGDGLDDLYFGGAKGFSGQLFLGKNNGEFISSVQVAFEQDAPSEDTDAVFFDADGDGALDLFVTSGGNEFPLYSLDLVDRLYLNDGNGNFKKETESEFQAIKGSSSAVEVIDINEDGNPDLFVGERLVPFVYGAPASSHIWINDGTGKYEEKTSELAPQLQELGMVTDASWVDWDSDGKSDLVLVGDWMAPTFFRNTGGTLEKIEMPEMENLKGWYRSLEVADLNQDNLPDLILGNQGLNTRFKASKEQPIHLYLNDFDQNGSIEQVFTTVKDGVTLPYTLKHELEMQIPSIKKKYIKYSNYNNQTLDQIFNSDVLSKSIILEANHLESGVLINLGQGNFEWKSFPREAQKSWVFASQVYDFNQDGLVDILLGGNLAGVKPQIGKSDASYGELLLGKGDGSFEFVPNRSLGLNLEGDIRHFEILQPDRLLIVKNNSSAEIWNYDWK
ncbi:VCBS repeat-containing protein [Algoriphagus sp. CAU 1675]|uniref:VCBS repeat-containing protein n=1 Tax=Algoriphagus sp. CAU 1675 TaxID=3032597 RepID=UPI0023DBA769|nr:VCBS repeat-containing protein [Algoriphagus sp. CAU 1675]MDF2158742.1 VCBS repeat-containing protein [Algoriphagus sp. CAU 1675]